MATAPSPSTNPRPQLWDDRVVVPFGVPLQSPASFTQLGEVTRAWAEGLLLAAVRLEVVLGLVARFPESAREGVTISPEAQTALVAILPDLGGLKSLLDQLAVWPIGPRSSTAPPPGVTFPSESYAAVTKAIRAGIRSNATTLEQAGAVSVERTRRGRRFTDLLRFPLETVRHHPRSRVALLSEQELPRPHAEARLVGQPYDRRYARLLAAVQDFRRCLGENPVATLVGLQRPIPAGMAVSSIPVIAPSPEAGTETGPRTRHSPDFATVNWYGTEYSFTQSQRHVVRLLWADWENGGQGVGADYLRETVRFGSGSGALRDVFKGRGGLHTAWGTMIVQTQRKGVYTLRPPTPGGPSGRPGEVSRQVT